MQKKISIALYLAWALGMAVYYYIYLPPINLTSGSFLSYIMFGFLVLGSIHWLLTGGQPDFSRINRNKVNYQSRHERPKAAQPPLSKVTKVLFAIPALIFSGVFVMNVINQPIFRAKSYANIISIETKDFTEFPTTDLSKIPLLDRDSAQVIGSTYLGSLTDKVSQYDASDEYVQLTVGGQPVRVTPLVYQSFPKWLSNKDKGIGEYIKIDMVTGNAEMVDLKEPIKYSTAGYFNQDILRHLRFRYPTTIFKKPTFEIDDEGRPYYVATTYRKRFGILVNEPTGVLIVDAATGQSKRYGLDEIPEWVDRVYGAGDIIDRIDWNGKYQNGFINTIWAHKGEVQTTEGYNYLTIGNDIYLYTGITSTNADQSNLGFVLVNMRTREITKYQIATATETTAQGSAEGSLQEKEYTATFPILISMNRQPYYIMSLKDNSGLIKAYAMVDAQKSQNVKTADSIEALLAKYGESTEEVSSSQISGVMNEIKAVVVDGDTVYYFKSDGVIYKVKASDNDKLPYITDGQSFSGQLGKDNYIKKIELP